MILAQYNRKLVLDYVRRFTLIHNPIFPDTSKNFSNNVNFVFQTLFNGGYFWGGSRYFDYFEGSSQRTIVKVSNLKKALEAELGAKKSTQLSFDGEFVKTGDVLIATVDGIPSCGILEASNNSFYFYSKSPIRMRVPIPSASSFEVYYIPDILESSQ